MRLFARATFLIAGLATGALACKRTETSSDGSCCAPAPASSLDLARTLAWAPPSGDEALDATIVELQSKSRQAPSDRALLASLGRAWLAKARATSDRSLHARANACVDLLLARDASDVAALDLRARILLRERRFDDARALIEKVVSRAPDEPLALGTHADALAELGRYEEAEVEATKAVDRRPGLETHARLAYLRWARGDREGARERHARAMSFGFSHDDPEPQAWALVRSGESLWHENDVAGADAAADLALSRLPRYPPALVLKARAALSRGDAPRAVEHLSLAFARSPNVQTAWLLGDVRTLASDAKGAEEAYAFVESTGRTNDPRALSLFWATKLRNLDEALALAERERALRGDVHTDDALAWALHRKGRSREAKLVADRALRFGTRDARLLYHAGAIRIALGEVGFGKKLVAEALALQPRFDATDAPAAKKLLGGT